MRESDLFYFLRLKLWTLRGESWHQWNVGANRLRKQKRPITEPQRYDGVKRLRGFEQWIQGDSSPSDTH
jgi:hypothetical protein